MIGKVRSDPYQVPDPLAKLHVIELIGLKYTRCRIVVIARGFPFLTYWTCLTSYHYRGCPLRVLVESLIRGIDSLKLKKRYNHQSLH